MFYINIYISYVIIYYNIQISISFISHRLRTSGLNYEVIKFSKFEFLSSNFNEICQNYENLQVIS